MLSNYDKFYPRLKTELGHSEKEEIISSYHQKEIIS